MQAIAACPSDIENIASTRSKPRGGLAGEHQAVHCTARPPTFEVLPQHSKVIEHATGKTRRVMGISHSGIDKSHSTKPRSCESTHENPHNIGGLPHGAYTACKGVAPTCNALEHGACMTCESIVPTCNK